MCIADTMVRYLVVSIVRFLFFGMEKIWLVFSGKGAIVCVMEGWVWFLFLWSSIIWDVLRLVRNISESNFVLVYSTCLFICFLFCWFFVVVDVCRYYARFFGRLSWSVGSRQWRYRRIVTSTNKSAVLFEQMRKCTNCVI